MSTPDHQTEFPENFKNAFDFFARQCYSDSMGLRNPDSIAAAAPSTVATSLLFTAQTHCIFAGLRELSCESMTGTTIDVFLTPYQARFFCAPKKGAREAMNSNDRIDRRSRWIASTLLHPGAARTSCLRSKKRPGIFTASHARFTAGAAGNRTPSPASRSPDGSSTAAPILTTSSRRGEL